MNTVPDLTGDRNVTEGEIINYFNGIERNTSANWPLNGEYHPFKFPWVNEEFREQFIHCMVTDSKGRTHHAAKDLLRWLMYRFRVAQYRRDNPPAPFNGHRWVWHKNSEVQRKTGLSDYQLRSAVAFLKNRRLIIQVYDSGVSNHRPHYRPTNDLFRAAHIVCIMSNEPLLWALYRARPDELYEDMDHILTERYAEVAAALVQFAESSDRGRARALGRAFGLLCHEVLGGEDSAVA